MAMYSEPCVPRRLRHRARGVLAVGLGRVHVQVAAQIAAFDEVGQLASRRGLDLAAPFAQLGRNPGEPERLVDLLFARARDARVVVGAKEAVFVQLEPEPDRAVAKRDVVRLRAGEVLHRGAAALGRHEPQIRLKAAPDQHARFRLALPEHPLDQLIPCEVGPSGTGRRPTRGDRGRRRYRSRAAGCRPVRSRPSARAPAR